MVRIRSLSKAGVYLYKDAGVGLANAHKLWDALKRTDISHSYQLRWVNKNNLVQENWEEHAAALIIPGGRDLPYHMRLQGIPNSRIRSYVMNGGSYLGICAGAYYGCSSIEFDIGHPLEVTGKRELQFFPGIGRGPAYGFGTFSYDSENGARVARLKMSDQTILASYYNGGCYFENADVHENIQVIARYHDIPQEPAAIVHCKIGKGSAILCGVHPEVSADTLHGDNPFKAELAKVEAQRKTLLQSLINLIL